MSDLKELKEAICSELIDIETAIEKQTEVLKLVLDEVRKLNMSPQEKRRAEDRP